MTPMVKPLAAALLAAPLALPAAAQTAMSDLSAYEVMILHKEIRDAVTESVIDYYGSREVVEDTSAQEMTAPGLSSGQPIPADLELQPVPDDLATMLPRLGGAEWMQAANHLVAVDNGTARLIVWEVLP